MNVLFHGKSRTLVAGFFLLTDIRIPIDLS